MSRTKTTPKPKVELSFKDQVISSLDGRIYINDQRLKAIDQATFTLYNIKWSSEEYVMRVKLRECLTHLYVDVNELTNEHEIRETLVRYLKSMTSKASSTTHNSTSAFGNAISFAEQKAYFEMIDFTISCIFG